MKVRGTRRLIKALGLALAVAACAAPAAQAMIAVEDGGVPAKAQVPLYSDNFHSSLPTSAVSPRTRIYTDARHQALLNRPVSHQTSTDSIPAGNSVVSESSSNFDWGDAGIGAGIAFVLVGLCAAILAARHVHKGRLAAV